MQERRAMSEAQHCKLLQNEPVSVYHSIAGHGMTRHAAEQHRKHWECQGLNHKF